MQRINTETYSAEILSKSAIHKCPTLNQKLVHITKKC